MAVVSAELDEETKRKAVLKPRGFSTTSVIQMIFTRIAKLPFESHEPDDGDALLGELRDLHAATKALLDKIEALPPERQTEVEDFVEFVQQRRGATLA
jgi:antitoxin component of RelBE/YafQ-DinJ toxin-antitoxin module